MDATVTLKLTPQELNVLREAVQSLIDISARLRPEAKGADREKLAKTIIDAQRLQATLA